MHACHNARREQPLLARPEQRLAIRGAVDEVGERPIDAVPRDAGAQARRRRRRRGFLAGGAAARRRGGAAPNSGGRRALQLLAPRRMNGAIADCGCGGAATAGAVAAAVAAAPLGWPALLPLRQAP